MKLFLLSTPEFIRLMLRGWFSIDFVPYMCEQMAQTCIMLGLQGFLVLILGKSHKLIKFYNMVEAA
jgi:hypothetical protein